MVTKLETTGRTHWVPPFTRRDDAGREQAICATYVTRDQIAPLTDEPTCWGCAVYLRNLDVIQPEPAAERTVA